MNNSNNPMETNDTHNLLTGKKGIITGILDKQSLAYYIAEQCYKEGAQMVLTTTPLANQLGEILPIASSLHAITIPCDITNTEHIQQLFSKAMQHFNGKIDFILHSVALSNNLRRRKDYDNLNYDYFMRTLDTSAISLHKILQTAIHMDAIAEWGSVVSLSYVAADRPVCYYADMGDAKALLQSITRSFGLFYGEKKHVRINTISQSPTLTHSTQLFPNFHLMQQYTESLSPIGNADTLSCAKLCVMLFSDYTRYVTMQNIFNDGGFANTTLTNKIINSTSLFS